MLKITIKKKGQWYKQNLLSSALIVIILLNIGFKNHVVVFTTSELIESKESNIQEIRY